MGFVHQVFVVFLFGHQKHFFEQQQMSSRFAGEQTKRSFRHQLTESTQFAALQDAPKSKEKKVKIGQEKTK